MTPHGAPSLLSDRLVEDRPTDQTGITAVGYTQAPVLAALHALSFSQDEQWSTQTMEELLASVGVWAGLAVWQGTPAGMIMLRRAADEAEVLTLCVAPAMRRYGLASQLVAWGLSTAATAGVAEMFLEVSVRNGGAIALYQQAGFARFGLRKRYYADGSDAYVLGRLCAGQSG